jgi:hypothetical protein
VPIKCSRSIASSTIPGTAADGGSFFASGFLFAKACLIRLLIDFIAASSLFLEFIEASEQLRRGVLIDPNDFLDRFDGCECIDVRLVKSLLVDFIEASEQLRREALTDPCDPFDRLDGCECIDVRLARERCDRDKKLLSLEGARDGRRSRGSSPCWIFTTSSSNCCPGYFEGETLPTELEIWRICV